MNVIGISGLHNSVAFKQRHFPDLSSRYHRMVQGFDSAAALVTDDGIRAAAAEERFTGEKATGAFPSHSVRFCLDEAELELDAVDVIAHNFDYEPYREFYDSSDYLRAQFDEVYSRRAQLGWLAQYFPAWRDADSFVQVPHHVAHAASAFYPSGMDESLILVTDGMGEQHSCTVAAGSGDDIEILTQIPALHSLGILYSTFTFYLGFAFSMDEYKVMGLAPYGNPTKYYTQIADLVQLQNDGTYRIPILFKNATLEDKETYRGTLAAISDIFGPPRRQDEEISQHHRDIAAGLQLVLQNSLLHVLRHFSGQTQLRNLCMAGGVALNCSANGVIKRSRLFRQFFVQPAAGDDGTALGAALHVHRQRLPTGVNAKMGQPLWGPEFEAAEIRHAVEEADTCSVTEHSDFEALAADAAQRIADGQILGWFQGRMEFGPRALGNRSILADPRDPEMRERLNRLVKKREVFRPFAPAVPLEDGSTFFELAEGDDALYEYMLCITRVRSAYRDQLPAITHIDGSARVQTVHADQNRRFWSILKAFGRLTGLPVLVNTSFNVKGQPIVCTPTEAVDTFLDAGLDGLVIGDFLVVPRSGTRNTTNGNVATSVGS